jgi:hypothetical protein
VKNAAGYFRKTVNFDTTHAESNINFMQSRNLLLASAYAIAVVKFCPAGL